VVAVRTDRPDDSDAAPLAEVPESHGTPRPDRPEPPGTGNLEKPESRGTGNLNRPEPGGIDNLDRPEAHGFRMPEVPESARATAGAARNEPHDRANAAIRTQRALDYRATADAIYDAPADIRGAADRDQAKAIGIDRVQAIDQAYERIREIEDGTVTPAMTRIEEEDPDRYLAGPEHRLKGKDRLTEKVIEATTERDRTVEQALATVKDAIRYTFCYSDEHYTEGVYRDCDLLEAAGFQRVERRNSWEAEQYKGINSRWRIPLNGQLFEVQFHTQASLDAKQETHWAYEKLRDPATTKFEQESLTEYQRTVSSRIPIPPGATEIPDYKYP